jgi:hypothetical protein
MDVVIETEHRADASDVVDDRVEGRQVSGEFEMWVVPAEVDLDHAGIPTDLESASIDGILDELYSGRQPWLEVPERGIAIQRLDERQPQAETAVGNQYIADAALAPKLAWREAEDRLDDPVHLTNAAESCSARNDRHREVRFIE